MLEFPSNKVAGLQACNFSKKRLQHRCFPANTVQFLRATILKNICVRLLLIMAIWLCFSKTFAILSRRNQLFSVGYVKFAILSKSKNNILSRTIQLFSEDQLLSFLLMLYLLLAQFCALISHCYLKWDSCLRCPTLNSCMHYNWILSIGPALNALLCIARCPTPNVLLRIAGCPTMNVLLHISKPYFLLILCGARLHIKPFFGWCRSFSGFPNWSKKDLATLLFKDHSLLL